MMSFARSLRDLGFTYVSIDMARRVRITAWRGTERKTYQVCATTIEEAEKALIDSINAPVSEPDDWEDIL